METTTTDLREKLQDYLILHGLYETLADVIEDEDIIQLVQSKQEPISGDQKPFGMNLVNAHNQVRQAVHQADEIMSLFEKWCHKEYQLLADQVQEFSTSIEIKLDEENYAAIIEEGYLGSLDSLLEGYENGTAQLYDLMQKKFEFTNGIDSETFFKEPVEDLEDLRENVTTIKIRYERFRDEMNNLL